MDKAWTSPAVLDSALTEIGLGRVQLISEPRQELMLMGGTGANSGITGTCTYEVEYLANNRYVSRAECAWQR